MHININNVSYYTLKSLTFAPQTDVTGSTVPVNEFTGDIVTSDDIAIGQSAELKNGQHNLWAKYSIVRADRIDDNTVRVVAQSPVMLLGDTKMPAVMYEDASAPTVLQEIILNLYSSVGSGNYTVDSALNSAKVNGFAPEQTPRERLQWVCYAIGAYVKTYFGPKIAILKVDTTPTLIPMERTFIKPNVTYNDYVTAIKGYSFSFAEGDPETTDEWVQDGNGRTYIVTRTAISLADNTVPSGARENIVELNDVMLVTSANAGAVMANVAAYQFARGVVDIDVINNGEYIPGMLVQFYTSESTMMQGYIQSCAFKFGLQARSTLHIIGGVEIETANLTVKYKFGKRVIDKKTIPLPIGFTYSVENPWFDVEIKGHRYVLRPTTEAVTGTMTSGGKTATVSYEAALDLYEGVLTVSNVDEITTQTEDNVVVGVIS